MTLIRILRRNLQRVQQPSENPTRWAVWRLEMKMKSKELLMHHKIAFISSRAVFNTSCMVLIAKAVIFLELGLDEFSWLGKYFPEKFEKAREKLHKGVDLGGVKLFERDAVVASCVLFFQFLPPVALLRTATHILLIEATFSLFWLLKISLYGVHGLMKTFDKKMTRFVPAGILRWCWLSINFAMLLLIYRFMILHQMENNRNFRLIWFANTIVTAKKMNIPYEKACVECFFASDYPAEFDIVWNNYESKLEGADIGLTSDLESLLYPDSDSETSVEQ